MIDAIYLHFALSFSSVKMGFIILTPLPIPSLAILENTDPLNYCDVKLAIQCFCSKFHLAFTACIGVPILPMGVT